MSDDKTRTSEASPPAETRETAEIEADIARTREELATTVDQLAGKWDVKTRARDRVTMIQDRATAQVQSARTRLGAIGGRFGPGTMALGAGIGAAVVSASLVRVWMRPSKRHSGLRRSHRRL
jgi:Protein of unknown function (DUF3618)